MKKFGFYVSLVGITVVSLMFLLDHIYSQIHLNGIARNKVQNTLKLKNVHYELAFFGSSRTENHIDCELITKVTGKSCINFGISGANLKDMLVIMKINKVRNVTYEKAFIQVDYNYNYRGLSPYFKANIAPYLNSEIIDKDIFIDKKNIFINYIPFYRYLKNDKIIGFRETFSISAGLKSNRNLSTGYFPKYGIGSKVAGVFPPSLNQNNFEITKMENLLTPSSIFYYMAPYCDKLKNREVANNLKYRIKPFRNFSGIFDDKPEYFFNCGHLNHNGAQAFTLKIIEDYNLF